MKILQKKYSKNAGWKILRNDNIEPALCNLVLVFSGRDILCDPTIYSCIKKEFPAAHILLNSTAGEIIDTEVNDETISLTAIAFKKIKIKTAITHIEQVQNSFEAGQSLAKDLDPEDLKYVLVISDGQKVNGSELVNGLQEKLPEGTIITGGLAGDGGRFEKTLVGLNEIPLEGRIAAIGFYGNNFCVSYGSVGGWDSFGPERLITRSDGNILYELDCKPALDIYKMYLGDYANELPGSGLLFPLSIRTDSLNNSLVRTILAVNAEDKSLTFAGNMPEGAYARLMKANFDRLIEGASDRGEVLHFVSAREMANILLAACDGCEGNPNDYRDYRYKLARSLRPNPAAETPGLAVRR